MTRRKSRVVLKEVRAAMLLPQQRFVLFGHEFPTDGSNSVGTFEVHDVEQFEFVGGRTVMIKSSRVSRPPRRGMDHNFHFHMMCDERLHRVVGGSSVDCVIREVEELW